VAHIAKTGEQEAGWLGDGERDLVSVIVPTFNRAGMLIELLENMSQQTWKNLQVIVVDDGSTDDTQYCIKKWQASNSELNLKLLTQENAGPSSARNLGLKHARGEFILFLDSDDLMYPNALSSMISAIHSSGRPYCVASVFPADANGIARTEGKKYSPKLSETRLFFNSWATNAALYNRTVLSVVGPFNVDLKLGEDTELNWRVVTIAGQPSLLDLSVGVKREHSSAQLWQYIDEAEANRALITAEAQFIGWAKIKGFHNRPLSLEILQHGIVLAIRFGSLPDWTYRDRALVLIGEARIHFPKTTMLLVYLLNPRSQLRFKFLKLLLELALYLRRTLNS
jgi:glycosyltransferase involved in cell wall biosynthesis